MATRQSPWPEVKILDFHTWGRETKTLRAWLPKEDNKLVGRGTKSSPTLINDY